LSHAAEASFCRQLPFFAAISTLISCRHFHYFHFLVIFLTDFAFFATGYFRYFRRHFTPLDDYRHLRLAFQPLRQASLH